MYNLTRIFVIILLISANIMTACGNSTSEITLDDVILIANHRRENITPPSRDRLYELIQNQEPLSEPVDLAKFIERNAPPVFLSSEEVIYDTQVLFGLLRDIYGAYEYFGGDEVFIPILNEIIDSLAEREQWPAPIFAQLVAEYLSQAIADNHFRLGDIILGANSHFFIWEEAFDKTDRGFRHKESGRYVREVVGFDIDDVFRLSMDEEGIFFYMPIIAQDSLGQGASLLTLHIIFEDGSEEERNLLNRGWSWINYEKSSLRFEEDIPIVVIRGMGRPDVAEYWVANTNLNQSARDFLSFTELLQDEPVVIIDIRSNFGGNPLLAAVWLYQLTGEIVPQNLVGLERIDNRIWPQEWDEILYINEEDLIRHAVYEMLGYYHVISYARQEGVVPNEQLLIFLVDRYTASAGDSFVDLALSLENTLIVGQNTSGMLIASGTVEAIFLPNSGIPLKFGSTLFLHPEGNFAEGLGIAPDVWVVGDALTATLAMLENYCR